MPQIPRLRDRPEFWDGREMVDQRAADWGGHWCVCYLFASDELCVAEYCEATRPNVERLLILYQRDGGNIKPGHPDWQETVLAWVRELVRQMGTENACRWARYVDSLSCEERAELAATNWHAAVVVAFRQLI